MLWSLHKERNFRGWKGHMARALASKGSGCTKGGKAFVWMRHAARTAGALSKQFPPQRYSSSYLQMVYSPEIC